MPTRLIAAIALLIVGAWFCSFDDVRPVKAQITMTGAGLGAPSSGGGGYTGPGDCSGCAFNASAKAWWGLRCYSNAYSGNVADVVDHATGNTTGTRLQCSGGTVSSLVSGSACTFVNGQCLFITRDESPSIGAGAEFP